MIEVLLAMLLQVPVAQPCADKDTVVLGVGTQKVVGMSDPSMLRATNPGVVDLKTIGKRQLLIIGASEGNTTVFLAEDGGVRSFRVFVRKGGDGCFTNPLANQFPCGSTLEMKMVGDRTYLEGEASSLEEWRAAFAVVAKHPFVFVLGRLKADVVEHTFVEAEAALLRAGLGRLRWVRAGESVSLEGGRSEEDDARRAAVEAEWRPVLEMVLSRPVSRKSAATR